MGPRLLGLPHAELLDKAKALAVIPEKGRAHTRDPVPQFCTSTHVRCMGSTAWYFRTERWLDDGAPAEDAGRRPGKG